MEHALLPAFHITNHGTLYAGRGALRLWHRSVKRSMTDKTNSAPLSDVLQTTENINAIFNLMRMKALVTLKI